MRRRSARSRALLALLPLAALAACTDEPPTLTGDPFFPGGSRPVTLEAIFPASQFLETLGVYTGFGGPEDFGYSLVANQFGGALSANTLFKLPFPTEITYSQGGTTRTDAQYRVISGQLVLAVDTAASADVASTTLRLYEVAQPFDVGSATWTLAVDTGAVETPWTQPGGTRGALLGQTVLTRGTATDADSVSIALDSATVNRLRAEGFNGVLLASAETGTRVQLLGVSLQATVRPSNATRDTTFAVAVSAGRPRVVFTPEPPLPAGRFAAGGIRAARTVFRIEFDQPLPNVCPDNPTTCPPVRLSDVRLNRVSLLLRRVPVPNGYDPLGPMPLTLWTVPDPEVGRRAPLGTLALDQAAFLQVPTDTVVELPLTAQAFLATRSDTTARAYALLGESPPSSTGIVRSFGLGLYEADPRLRVVYTLPIRPRLP